MSHPAPVFDGGPTATFARYTPIEIKRAIVARDYDTALEGLSQAIKGDGKPYCHLCERGGNPQPWAIKVWMEAAGVTGATQNVVINLYSSLGVKDEVELGELIESGRRMKQLTEGSFDLDAAEESVVELARTIFSLAPERREGILARLGSSAEVIESENGHE